jgi:NAD(P)-dependent dehydrogenase (short-subunit alcohol dehydrogenase family)
VGHLDGRRVLVVGASAGIGRAFARAAVAAGATTVVAARRRHVLDEVVREAGGGTPIAADICIEDDRRALVEQTLEQLGGLDLVLSTVGVADLSHLLDADAASWTRTLEVNVVAQNQLLRELVPRLEPGTVVAVASSDTAMAPRAALVAYAASKAALETSLQGWRTEHPGIRFSCVALGATIPTEFGDSFHGPTLGAAFGEWARHGQVQERYMDADEVARFLVAAYGAALDCPSLGVEHLTLRSPSRVAAASPPS